VIFMLRGVTKRHERLYRIFEIPVLNGLSCPRAAGSRSILFTVIFGPPDFS
jgi:hypothetical protein